MSQQPPAKINGYGPPDKHLPDDWEEVFDDVDAGVVPPDAVRALKESGGPGDPPNLTKFTPERVAVIFEGLSNGYPKSTSAELAGITRQTLDNWLNRGKEANEKLGEGEPLGTEEERYLYFYYGVKQSMVGWEKEAIEAIKEAGFQRGNWQALMTLLERTRPERYGRHQQVDHSVETDGDIEISFNIGDKPEPREVEPADYQMNDDE